MNESISIADLRKLYPFPWTHIVFGRGLIQVSDATGKEVPILTMVAFLSTITTILNQSEKKT